MYHLYIVKNFICRIVNTSIWIKFEFSIYLFVDISIVFYA